MNAPAWRMEMMKMTRPYTWMQDLQNSKPREYSDEVRLHILNELYVHLVHVSGEHGAATDVYRKLVIDAEQLAEAQKRVAELEAALRRLYDDWQGPLTESLALARAALAQPQS